MARRAGPGCDRLLLQVVVEDDVADIYPPDQGEPRTALTGGVALGTMQVDAYVIAVGDLEPEPLPAVVAPPGVDVTCLIEPVRRRRVSEPDPRRRCPLNDGIRQREQDGAHERAAVAKGCHTDLDLTFFEEPVKASLHPFDRHRLTRGQVAALRRFDVLLRDRPCGACV